MNTKTSVTLRLAEAVNGPIAAPVAPDYLWGENCGPDWPPEHRNIAHRLFDVGAADMVRGHSSHHPLPSRHQLKGWSLRW